MDLCVCFTEEQRRLRAGGDHEAEAGEDRLWHRLKRHQPPKGFHLLVTLQRQQLLQPIDSRAHGNVVNMFNCIFIISQCVCIQVFSYLIMLLVFLSSHEIFSFGHESVYSFLCVCVSVCARLCVQNKHANIPIFTSSEVDVYSQCPCRSCLLNVMVNK